MMKNFARHFLFVLPVAVVLAACSEDPAGTVAPPPAVVSAIAAPTRHPLVQSLTVTLEAPAALDVEYRTPTGAMLHVVADSVAKTHVVMLTRMKASATYAFNARAVNAAGSKGEGATGTFQTGALGEGVRDFDFEASGIPGAPVTLLQISTTENNWFGMVAIDGAGDIVWYHRVKGGAMGSVQRPNGEIVVIDGGLYVVNMVGDTVASLPKTAASPFGDIHHAVTPSPAGGLLFIAKDPRVIRDTTVVADAVWEWTPETNALVKRWSAHDFYDWSTERGPAAAPNNWLHTNAISVGARGNYIIAHRNHNQVTSISSDWKTIEWRLGGPGATITLPPGEAFTGQHGANEYAPGHVLLFDNGIERAEVYSRAVEFEIDLPNKRATKVWEYRPTPDVQHLRLGSVFRLPNGNTHIDFGWLLPDVVEIVEVTPTGSIAWRAAPTSTMISKIYHALPRQTLFGETEVGQ